MGNKNGTRVSIVGAGYISPFHAEILGRQAGVRLVSVVDPNSAQAAKLADEWGIPKSFASVEEMLAEDGCDVAHVLVPPPVHKATTLPLLEAGVHVLLEKPMVTTAADCAPLLETAKASGALLGINQSFIFDPAFLKLKKRLLDGRSGKLHHLSVSLNLPLRQLSAGQFGHWMFRAPQNIVYEQAVHPVSQILDLAGSVQDMQTTVGPPRELVPDMRFYDTWQVAMRCEKATAQLFMAFGKGMPSVTIHAICEDESIVVDLLANRVSVVKKTRWHDVIDTLQNGLAISTSGLYQSLANTTNQALSMVRLKGRTDSFYVSMRKSIEAFYAGLDRGKPAVDGEFGAEVINVCARMAEDVARVTAQEAPELSSGQKDCDVVVIGGTGFIGRSVVKAYVDAGHTVRVVARNTSMLPELFQHENVELMRGVNSSEEDISRAVKGARIVVDLAHGGAANLQEVKERMIGGAQNVARCCLQAKVERLVFASTIAALYLGDADATITGMTPVDPEAESRAIYAFGKAECERLLMVMHRDEGLPVCIVRPGVVIGAGGLPAHSGIGTFVRDKHCIGWNRGNNPLPLVLADDVAAAIMSAATVPEAVGRTYNLVGDVRLNAREYVGELQNTLQRSIVFHPRSASWLQGIEIGKWLVKAAGRRADNPFPSYRDLLSRGMKAKFDCSDTKRDLNWSPVSDRGAVIAQGIQVYGTDT